MDASLLSVRLPRFRALLTTRSRPMDALASRHDGRAMLWLRLSIGVSLLSPINIDAVNTVCAQFEMNGTSSYIEEIDRRCARFYGSNRS